MLYKLILSFVTFGLIILSCSAGYYKGNTDGYIKGRQDAFESIILEECWLNKVTRDINCIEYIAGDKTNA